MGRIPKVEKQKALNNGKIVNFVSNSGQSVSKPAAAGLAASSSQLTPLNKPDSDNISDELQMDISETESPQYVETAAPFSSSSSSSSSSCSPGSGKFALR